MRPASVPPKSYLYEPPAPFTGCVGGVGSNLACAVSSHSRPNGPFGISCISSGSHLVRYSVACFYRVCCVRCLRWGQAGCRSQALRPHRRARKVDYGGARSLAPTQPGAHTPYHPRCSRLKVTGVLALQDYSRITSSSSWEQSQAFFRTPSLLRCLRVSSYALSCGSFTGSVASNTMWICPLSNTGPLARLSSVSTPELLLHA